ncbi:MAG: hypothetical protein Q7S65_06060 [Nanoarchaeota archaeon]|nr:hypothetical protein [Nanoarchaeota archaeon]
MHRGQVTLFVILGVVLVIAAGVFLVVRQQTAPELLTEIPGQPQSAGQQKVRQFMDSCIREATVNGVEILRLQGGYIDLPPGVKTIHIKDPNYHQIVERAGLKTVVIDPAGSGNDLPFWLDSDDRMAIPPPLYIEGVLAEYITESIQRCAHGLSSFEAQGYAVELGVPQTTVELSDEVTVRLQYPLKLSKNSETFQEEEFIYRLPIDFREVLMMAMELTFQEYYHYYLEHDIKNILMLYAFDGRESTKNLPPITHTSAGEECDEVTWEFSKVQQALEENFRRNVPFIQVAGYGDSIPEGASEIGAGTYRSLTHDLLGKHQPGEVRFRLGHEGDFIFDITPRSGKTIKPDTHSSSGIPSLPMFCHVRYQFKYTLKFPVISTIVYSPNPGLNLEGKTVDPTKRFEMPLALGVHICGNQARKCTGTPAYFETLPALLAEFDQSALGPSYCESEQRTNQPQTITLTDRDTGAPLNGTVFYSCVTGECPIGAAKDGRMEAPFPICVNGVVSAIVSGYRKGKSVQTMLTDTPAKEISLALEPIRHLNVEVKTVSIRELFQQKLCGVQVNDVETIAFDPGTRFSIIITGEHSSTPIIINYPDQKIADMTSGEYIFKSIVTGTVKFPNSEVDGEPVSPTKEGPYEGPHVYGAYGEPASFAYEALRSAHTLVLYVPIETDAESIDIFNQGRALNEEGAAVFNQQYFDADCDPATVGTKVNGRIEKEELQALLRPRLK